MALALRLLAASGKRTGHKRRHPLVAGSWSCKDKGALRTGCLAAKAGQEIACYLRPRTVGQRSARGVLAGPGTV
jgi:hypothetical protein